MISVSDLRETVSALNAAMERTTRAVSTAIRPSISGATGDPDGKPRTEHEGGSDSDRDARSDGRKRPGTRSKKQYLSAEEEIIQYLTEHADGRSWQGAIAEELAWSASKTSRVLCAMEDRDGILRYRVGKRKCVFLPGNEPDALRPIG